MTISKNNLIKFNLLLIFCSIFTFVIVHFLRTDGSVIGNTLSNYANSSSGNIFKIGFYFFFFVKIIIGILLFNYKN